ncbi:MAG: RNA chaperone Hfq [Planctomycetota bacterium]|jgi:sRNA-binding regulator protein Hfq
MGKKKTGGFGPMKIIEQEITKFGTRLRKVEDQVSGLRDLTWVAADLLNELGGKKVKIRLVDGKDVKGVLECYDRFNIRVKADKGRNLVIMKHAVMWVEPI